MLTLMFQIGQLIVAGLTGFFGVQLFTPSPAAIFQQLLPYFILVGIACSVFTYIVIASVRGLARAIRDDDSQKELSQNRKVPSLPETGSPLDSVCVNRTAEVTVKVNNGKEKRR